MITCTKRAALDIECVSTHYIAQHPRNGENADTKVILNGLVREARND